MTLVGGRQQVIDRQTDYLPEGGILQVFSVFRVRHIELGEEFNPRCSWFHVAQADAISGAKRGIGVGDLQWDWVHHRGCG